MSAPQTSNSVKFRRAFYFFPIQLLFLHLKRSHIVVILWILLFGIITQLAGTKYGLPYLFLYPEYLEEVNFWSYLILGFSCGGFIMSFNMYSYIVHGFKFRFIATVSKPYQRFSINNSFIPIVFVFVYLYSSFCFQVQKEFEPVSEAIVNLLGFIVGILSFIAISNLYFFRTNKDLFKISGKKEEEYEKEISEKISQSVSKQNKFSWRQAFSHDEGWTVETYMASPFKWKLARDTSHYDIELIKKVFYQNHLNASIFEITVIISFLLLGSFKENPVFLIPAGASIFLFLTIVIMIISAFYTWFRGWTFTLIIFGIIFLNFLSQKTELFAYKNFAYGLDYSNKLAKYDPETIRKFNSDSVAYDHDKREMIEILNRWKRDLKNEFGIEKPPLVLFCASGGGIRSSVWTFTVMQKLDSVSNGMFGRYCRLITGASGGMIGASYYRELMLQQNEGKIKSTLDKKYSEYLSQDILNPVAFCIATSDVFIRYQHFKDGPYSYTIDRGYFFEKEINENLLGAFSKRLYEYKVPEENGDVPMVVMSPTIINHGRKLIISPLNTSYFTYHNDNEFVAADGNIEFKRFFKGQNSVNLRFSTALRMSATFPFVMPMVSLPTDPGTEAMDAGIRDNYGTSLAVRFITEFKNWIQNNTSGVILITTRDRPRILNTPKINNSLYAKMSVPAANLVDNVFYTQDFENDQLLENTFKLSGLKIQVIDFYLPNDQKNKVSLSWHLTKLEKMVVQSAIDIPYNKYSFRYFVEQIKKGE
jgi:hypothetical protein